MKGLRIVMLVVGVGLLGQQPADAGALRWVARATWRCPVIHAAVTGAAKGAVEGAKVAIGALY